MTDYVRAAGSGGRRTLHYLLDAQDRIAAVGDDWDAFARQNSGAGVLREDVLGQPLWRYVAGDATRSFLNALFFWSRTRGLPYRTSYRCDSPLVRRRYEMTIAPQRSGLLKVESRLVELRSPAPERFEGFAGRREVERCSMCLRCHVDGGWAECGHAELSGVMVRYEVCPDCRAEAADALRDADVAKGAATGVAGRAGGAVAGPSALASGGRGV